MVRFSIIIPVYNVALYLRECLDSVLAQTFNDWEAICVDDGSTDGSGAILDEYVVKDQRFRIIHQRNAGVSCARNVALDVASGEWLIFVDSDDQLHPSALTIGSKLISGEVDAISFWHGEKPDELTSEGVVSIIDNPLFDPQERHWRWWKGSVVWGRLWRRSVVGDIRFPTDRCNGEDTIWCNKALSRIRREIETSAKLYYYRPYNGLSSNANAWRNIFKAWPDLYAINPGFSKYNGVWAWNIFRQYPCYDTVLNVRTGLVNNYISLELLPSVKKMILLVICVVPNCILRWILRSHTEEHV